MLSFLYKRILKPFQSRHLLETAQYQITSMHTLTITISLYTDANVFQLFFMFLAWTASSYFAYFGFFISFRLDNLHYSVLVTASILDRTKCSIGVLNWTHVCLKRLVDSLSVQVEVFMIFQQTLVVVTWKLRLHRLLYSQWSPFISFKKRILRIINPWQRYSLIRVLQKHHFLMIRIKLVHSQSCIAFFNNLLFINCYNRFFRLGKKWCFCTNLITNWIFSFLTCCFEGAAFAWFV